MIGVTSIGGFVECDAAGCEARVESHGDSGQAYIAAETAGWRVAARVGAMQAYCPAHYYADAPDAAETFRCSDVGCKRTVKGCERQRKEWVLGQGEFEGWALCPVHVAAVTVSVPPQVAGIPRTRQHVLEACLERLRALRGTATLVNDIEKNGLGLGEAIKRSRASKHDAVDAEALREMFQMPGTRVAAELREPYEYVEHPAHYGGSGNPYEVIKVIEAWKLNFNLGTLVRYVGRLGKKPGEDALRDLKKARWYLDREIQRLEADRAEE